jgi:L-threonylcarbamoyladenylate synthase
MRMPKRRLRAHLSRGGLVAYPTESCFGLGCDPANARALRRLLRLKRRPAHKGLIVIGATRQQLSPWVDLPAAADTASLWPGPNTLLLPAHARVLPLLRGRHRQLAVRIPAWASARQLCQHWGGALVSTSANLAGRKSLKNARAVARQFGGRVLVIPGRIGPWKQPSRIIDWASGTRLR